MSDVAIGVTVGVAVLGLLYTFTNSGRPRNDVQNNNYGANNSDDRNSYHTPDEIRTGGKKSKTSKKSKTQRKSRKRS
jgi:hypothetical protein